MSEHDVIVTEVPGVGRVVMVMPVPPDDAPLDVREGIARRRLVMLTGQCPCGARRTLPNRAQRRALRRSGAPVWHLDVRHADDCPATDAALARYGWTSGGIR